LFKSVFYENPNRLSIHQYASKFDKKKLKETNNTKIDYDLNKNKKILITDDLKYYKNQPFIKAYKTKRFLKNNLVNYSIRKNNNSGNTHGFLKREVKLKKKNILLSGR